MIKRLNRLKSQLLLGMLLLCTSSIHAQQTHLLLDPLGAGGFELGTTFETNGWTIINGTQTNKWVLGAIPDWFVGNRGAYISNDNGVSYAYTLNSISRVHFYRDIVFPVGTESVTINLDVYQAGESTWDNVMVYIADTSIVPSSLGPVGTATTVTSWVDYEDGLTGYFLDRKAGAATPSSSNINITLTPEQVSYVSGNTKRLIITWKNDGGGGAQPPGSVDNIKVEAYVPACFMVDNLVVSNLTDTSFTATWNVDTSALGYEYELRSSGAPNSGAEGLISSNQLTSNTISFSSLLANTNYKLYVRKNCSATLGISSWKELNIRTNCGVVTSINENFDTVETGGTTNPTRPTCWGYIDSSVGYAYVTTSAQYNSVKGIYMYNGTDVTNDLIMVSPETNNLGNGGYRLRFRAKTTSTAAEGTDLKIVSLANQVNTTGMSVIETINLNSVYKEYIVNLPVGTNDFFGFKHGLNATARYIYIDDVVYEPIPPCSSPTTLVLGNVTSNAAVISWNVPSTNTASAQYFYELRTSGAPGSGSVGLAQTNSISGLLGELTLSNLAAGINYTLYLRGTCADGDSDVWREINFSTLCGLVTSINEGFDAVGTSTSTSPVFPQCWGYIDSSGGYAYVSSTAQYNSTKGIYMYNASDVTNDLIVVSPETNNLGNGGYRLRFRAKTTSTLGTDLQVVSLSNQLNSNGINILQTINLTTAYNEYIVYLPQGTNDFFGFRHGLNATLRYIYIDDVVYEPIPACPNIQNLTFVSSTQNSATVSWTLPPGLESNANLFYEVRFSGEPGSGSEGLAASGNLVASNLVGTINGIQHSTQYTVYVKTVCSASGFDGWQQTSFVSQCSTFDTINESFTGVPTGGSANLTLPLCWSFIDDGAGFGYVSTGSNFTTPNGFYMSNSSDVTGNYVLVSPETNNLGNGNYRLRFRAKTTSTSGEELEVLTLPGNGSTDSSVLIATVPLTTTYNEYVVYLPAGTHDYFGLKHGTSGTSRVVYIDDVVLEPRPSCVEVQNLVGAMNYAQSSATLVWENPNLVGLSNQFEIEYGVNGFVQGTGTIQTVTGLSTTITGLTQGVTYQFYVRRVCSETDKSAWSTPYSILIDYCTSIPTSNDNLGITQFVLGAQTFTVPDVFYHNLLDQVVTLDSQELINSSITFATGYTYGTHIWIDFNKDGIFDNVTEKVYTGESTNVNPVTLNTSFNINGIYETGIYRMRIGTADSGQATPNPCYSGSFGVTIDIKVNITFPCLDPTDLEVSSVSTNSATLNWSAAGSNFDIEYGPQGFQQGTGTVISNVGKPYVLNNLNEATNYSFYVKQVCVDGQSEWSNSQNFRTVCGTPSPIGDSFQTLVEDDFVSDIVAQGQSLRFYTDVELTEEVTATTVLTEGYYYITQTIGCESELPLEVYVTLIERIDEPVVPTVQEFCGGATLSNLAVTALPGATVSWFATSSSNTVLSADSILVSGIYYVNQTDGVTTSHRVPVNVIVNQVPVDIVSTDLLICGYSNFESLEVGQQEGVTMKWYATATATAPISNTQQVVTGTYFVTQSFGICESNRVQINIVAYDSLPSPIASTQTFCGSATVSQLVAQGVTGAQLKWYNSATSSTQLNSNTALVSGTYYVEQQKNGCVSVRKPVAVRIVSMTAPVVSSFTFCGSAHVSDLVIPAASGVTHKWYLSPSTVNPLTQETPLATGTYFVSQVQYGCESNRTAVQVEIASLPSAPFGSAVQTFIEGSVISDLVLNQSNIVWYISYSDSQNGINPLLPNMPLVNGATYYAVIIGTNGCPSLPFAVTVNVYLSNDQFDKNELKYYPNPVDNVLTISYAEDITQVEVFDLLGKRVKSFNTSDKEVGVDLSGLASGTYLIQLKTETKQQFIKIVKK